MAHSSSDRKRQRLDSPALAMDEDVLWALIPTSKTPNACARWCSIVSSLADSTSYVVKCDAEKIKCLLSDEERNDQEVMRRLVCGIDVSLAPRLHPLVFDSDVGPETASLRSIAFFRRLVSNENGARDRYKNWDAEKKRIVGLGTRDLFLANSTRCLDDDEKRLVRDVVQAIGDPTEDECVVVDGVNVSFYPTPAFKTVKYIEDLDTKLDPKWRPWFAQVLDSPRLFQVFVDPAELSFHNFENIVPLDRWVEKKLPREAPTLGLADVVEVQQGKDVWTAKLQGAGLLKEISDLDLYVAPLNKAIRGGERFIFQSTLLSKALSSAVSSSDLFPRLSSGSLNPSDFAFVNYVFRCNRFAPGDAKFASHLDTPYYDGARSQVSKYTLLIYLNSGRNPNGALDINGVTLNDIEEFTCVIFDQRHVHEGHSFIDSTKIFIRTELVFNDKKLAKNPKIASLFSEACYMMGQSAFDQELASYAHECFERANSLHWAIEKDTSEPPVYLYKQYLGFNFLTNGYDYWFAKSTPDGPDLIDCALLAVLDYLNCKIGSSGPFRALCRTTTIREPITSTIDAFRFLTTPNSNPTTHTLPTKLPRLSAQTLSSLFNKSPCHPFTPRPRLSWVDSDEDSDPEDGCCPMHCWTTFNAWDSPDVAKQYSKAITYTKNRLFSTPIVFLGEEITINEERISIQGDKILFYMAEPDKETPRFNFAACWGDANVGAEMFIGVDGEVLAPRLLVPPVAWKGVVGEGWHLVMDFFRNDWMIDVGEERTVVLPGVTNEVKEEMGEEEDGGPFWRRIKELAGGSEGEVETEEDEEGQEREGEGSVRRVLRRKEEGGEEDLVSLPSDFEEEEHQEESEEDASQQRRDFLDVEADMEDETYENGE